MQVGTNPTSFTIPNTIIAIPMDIPIIVMEMSGFAMNKMPTTQNTTDITIYPVFAIRIGATERIFMKQTSSFVFDVIISLS